MIFRSPYPEVSIPEVSFSDFLLGGCRVRGEAPAFVDGPTGRVLTFAQLAESAEFFGAGLTAQGLQRGMWWRSSVPTSPSTRSCSSARSEQAAW